MQPTKECFQLIKKWEGLHKQRSDGLIEAYSDPVSIWTIGYGSIRHWDLGRPVQPGDVITEATAERWLGLEVEQVAEDVEPLCKVPLTQGMFDALVSFVYNIGVGAFGESTILNKKLNQGDYEGAAREFDRWVNGTDNGVRTVFQGLIDRRNEEEAMFRRDGLSPGAGIPPELTSPNVPSPNKGEFPYKPAPLPLPFERTLRKGDVGDDCYILNCALAELGLLRIAPQPNEFTQVTEDAVLLFQRREALSRIEGLVGPETKRAIENALRDTPPEREVYCRLFRTGAGAYEGLEQCKLQFVDPVNGVVDWLDVVSGVPGAQSFLLWSDPDSQPGNLAPIPQDRYTISDIVWASGKKDDYETVFPKPGLGPVFVPIVKSQERYQSCNSKGIGCRDDFGFHADWNWITNESSPGSAGCVCPSTEDGLDGLKELVRLLRKHDPRVLIVDWGL